MTPSSRFDQLLDGVIAFLQHRNSASSVFRTCVRRLKQFLLVASVAYSAWIISLSALLRYHGERSIVGAVLIYVPQQLWLLPLIILTPASLLLERRALFFQLVTVLCVVVGLMGFCWGQRPTPAGQILTVLTNNRGQDNRQSLTPFLQAQNADIALFQEDGRAAAFRTAYPDRYCASLGEFTIMSKFPLGAAKLVHFGDKKPIAARWEVLFPKHVVIVYNVHFPTPRRDLADGRRSAFRALMMRPRLRWQEELQVNWSSRIDSARQFAELIESEASACIVGGDFNAPTCGFVYRELTSRFRDSFADSGRGFGFTFPGDSRNPLTLFGPWLRIDHILANRHLTALSATVEPGRRSQHRAAVARFELR